MDFYLIKALIPQIRSAITITMAITPVQTPAWKIPAINSHPGKKTVTVITNSSKLDFLNFITRSIYWIRIATLTDFLAKEFGFIKMKFSLIKWIHAYFWEILPRFHFTKNNSSSTSCIKRQSNSSRMNTKWKSRRLSLSIT